MPTAELAPKDAQQRVERFVSRFGPGYRRLARHAALPLVLTPELLHYLRNAFLRGQVPWVAEADLLLSDLCEEVGYEQYVMHPAVRARLITELRAEPDGPERVKEVARLLLQYLRRLERAGAGPGRDALPVQQWSALAYLDSDRVSHEVHKSLAELVARLQARPNEVNALAALANITRNLAPQLDQSPELVALAREITGLLTGEGAPSGQQDGQEPHRIQPEDVQPVPRSLVSQFPDQVGLAETVSLLVSLSAGPDQGSSFPVALPVGSAIDVVVVPKRGLVLEGKGKGTLVVSDQEETLPLQFKLRAIELGPARLQVHAFHQGQTLGMTSLAPTVAVGQGYDLRLMFSVNDVSDIPTEGKNLIIMAAVKNVLHFRIFDCDGKMVVDTDETKLTTQAGPIEDLRKQLESLWPPHGLTSSEKDRVITAVTSILRVPTRLNVMRLGLIADIHADIRALEKALLGLEAHGVDQILCAGDLVGFGHEPDAVVALIRDRAIPCIRGNHDRWVIERHQMLGLRGWKAADLRDDTMDFLGRLPASRRLECEGWIIELYHGSPASDTEYVSPYKPLPPSIEQFWDQNDAGVLVLGHTHIPMIDRGARGTIINPGSVLNVPGVQTSYSFAIVDLDLDDLSVRIFDIRTGREIRRDPIVLARE